MKVDAALAFNALSDVPAVARRLEEQGYDGLYTFEGPHDPFFPLLLAGEHTERLELTTAVAIAFARNPMTLASTAYDLQLASRGRFNLGLGTQIRPHVERRFSMPWSKPVERMREMVLAIRAIWSCWHDRTKLEFRGEHYTHTLMTPFFDPGPNPYGLPRIFLAGVGPRMTEVAGEVADGFLVHPFSTAKYMRETTLPALERGLARSGRTIADLEIAFPVMAAAYTTEAERDRAFDALRSRIAFYGSTPAYRPVLDAHGWGELQAELNALSKRGDWAAMADQVTDEIVDEFCVIAPPEELPDVIRARYGGIVQRVSLDAAVADPAPLVARLKA
ncbi:MAG: LLM class F420-dependent oxidoreductase [Acidimicrobiia bacterium]|nr:MAG: LLM class F420-dependent oxidoreductase [Acidimicrobiia bacterium]